MSPEPNRRARPGLIWLLLLIGFLLLWLACLALAVIGSQGMFGLPPDPFAAVFLIFVGLPWSMAVVPLTFLPIPLWITQALVALAPGISAYVIWSIYKARRQK